MSTARFLAGLRERGIELRAENDRLIILAAKGAVTSELSDELRRRKAELMTFLRMGDEGSSAMGEAGGPLPRASLAADPDGTTVAPASFGQRRLFYLDQLVPGLAVYNVPVAFFLGGEVDVPALRAALGDLVQRHGALRTTLRLGAAGLAQHVAPALEIPFETITIDEADQDTQDRRCTALLEEHARRPFDLTKGPLLRAAFITLGARRVLLLTAHHAVTDGWSQAILERELVACYAARRAGQVPTLPALPIQYTDYAAWQTSDATDVDPARQQRVEYWKRTLALPLPVLELPTMRPRPQMAPADGETVSATLPRDLTEPLAALARKEGATLFMVLAAAYATLLHRVCGQDELVIGTPVANRAHAETLDLIGYFANTIALRVDLSGKPTFRELLRRVRDVCVGAFANQDVPFEEVAEVLNVKRDLSRSPVFQTIFAFEDTLAPPPVAADAPLTIERRETIHAKVARTDLGAWVSATPEGLLVTLEFPTALYDSAAMSRLLEQFRVLLRAVGERPETPISALPLLSEAERHRMLVEWNATLRPLPPVVGAHQLVEQQVDATPTAPALVFGDEALTYAELDERANRLAHHLGAHGVTAGVLVGVFVERSLEMVVALLAVWKASGAYVPLDPNYPAARLALMIEDSGLGCVVTTSALRDRLPGDAKIVALDTDAAAIAARPGERPRHEGQTPSERPAYVIYTSGSTGRPKGVVLPQRAIVNFLASMAERPGLTRADTLLAVTTLSFDIAGLEIFLPITVGARIVIASADDTGDGPRLRALLEKSGTTTMQATPATWRLLLAAGWQGSAAFKALCGGEAMPPELAAELKKRTGQLWNMYGPTETTVWSTCAPLHEDATVTIGRPIGNTTVYLLDPNGEPVPVGVYGELMIGGLGVAIGYHARPDLTSERFVHDPFVSGGRMYRTGDLASFLPDGRIVYARRLDHQVKVRGYRIELGEIESVLAEHDAVAQNVVLVREDRPGDVRLVAYVVPRPGQSFTATELRRHLRKRLPDYMLPQHLVELERFPLTPAGKVARKDLPAPTGVVRAAEARQPTTPSEITLAKIWRDVLHVDSVAASDNFFDLGGHSLLSMIVVARVRAETGCDLELRELLLGSLEQLATRVVVQPTA